MIEPLEPLHALLHPHDQTRLDILYRHCMRQDRAINMLIEEHNNLLDRMRRSFDVPPPELYGTRDPNRGDDR